MSGEVPVCDVLLEAAEYLCKLGGNLKIRSENLKEKRITKDKLRNTHAVQKAADKLLLICELSKKSLSNVELGVKKILSVCGVSANSQPSTSSTSSPKKPDNHHYHIIKYGSRRLKIKQKVNFQHYESVKVFAKRLPAEMQEKYPVYYDCKLYRLRKKRAMNKKDEDASDVDIHVKKDHLGYEKDSERCTDSENKVVSSEKDEESLEKTSSNDRKTFENIALHTEDDEKVKGKAKEDKLHKNSESSIKYKDKSVECESISSDEDRQVSSEVVDKGEKEDSKAKDVEGTAHSDSNLSEGEDKSTQSQSLKKTDETVKADSNIQPKKLKRIRFADNCSSSDDNTPLKKQTTDINPEPVSDRKISASPELTSENSNMSNESNKDKPLLKCIDLTKLLKPEVAKKIQAIEKSNMSKKNKNAQKFYRSDEAILDDKKYWEEKRKEVCAFKPKQFIISVTKLPEFSEDFLSKHNIKRIIQNEKVLVEIGGVKGNELEQIPVKDKNEAFNEDIDSDAVKESNKKEKSNKMLKPDINKAKNALLDDSDSDKLDQSSSSKPTADTDKIKHALLHDSDSDKNNEGDTEVIHNNTEKLVGDEKSTDKDNVDSKQNELQQESSGPIDKDECDKADKLEETNGNSKDDSANVKTSLLRDSSDDEPKTPSNKGKHIEASTPPSKRKRIMESMKAKRMLMTYSSSSDTEDEQLRNALKEIKDSLLEGSSDEQSKSIIERMRAKRKKPTSSSSDDDKLDEKIKKVKSKKKRKVMKKEVTKEESSHSGQDEDNSTISQVDGNMDENSNSSSKMGRSKVKPNASSSQNSDTQETDKDIDGLTNLKTLAPRRRKDSSSTSREERPRTRGARLPKAPAIAEDVMLDANSNSSAEESAGEDAEELPPVTVTGLNGSGAMEHLAKDDLLDESDASSSQNKSSEDNKKEDDDESADEENVKSKRRKAPAISSDSEGGSKKDPGVKLSDFEDSGAESSEPGKRGKRKKKGSDSDASVGSDDVGYHYSIVKKDPGVKLSDFEDSGAESSEPGKRGKRKKKGSDSDASADSDDVGKKKRRRIKHVDDTDASGSESETEGQKRGRKNIRKVMGKDQLEEATKKAAREERERVARIAERQRLYNNLQFDESGKPDEVVLDKVVLDFDPETKEPLIQVDPGLVKKLKPHQANGIKFMWDACFESAKRSKKDKGSGCILAHCMGLGKTLQVVSLTHTLLVHGKLTGVKRVLVVCPLSTVLNWVNEFNMWLKHANADYDVDVYELSRFKQNSERAFQLQQWLDNGGVCVLGYEMFRNLSADNSKKYRKKMLQTFQRSLVDPGPDLVVCDEGHLLKNEKTSLSQSMNRVKTLRRIVLTGTPLQNNLKEYYCMVQFVKPNLLGKYNEYLNRFVNPITNGQYTDSTDHDIRIMKRRSHVLHKMLDGAVQRRDYGVLAPFLPPKHEYVLFITLTDIQTKLYQHYLDNYSRRPLPGKSSGFLFPDFQSLQRIWTHPLVLKYNSERYEIMQQKKRDKEEEEDSEGSLADFIDDESTPPESTTEESSDDLSDASDDSRKKSKKKKASKKSKRDSKANTRRATRANPVELDPAEEKALSDIEEVKNENPTEWWIKLVNDEELDDLRNSHKLLLLFEILRQCEAIGDKLLVFSQSLYSLDLIEHFLGKIDEATQEARIDEKLGNHVGSWSPGVDYFRLDGSTSCENRSIWCKNFNREDNPRARLFLISTRAGGLGINLVAANRVVIFDVSWNPSHDVQSIFRVYRFGQKKPCYIYRFLAMGTMEEKIYERQVTKQAISKRVIDEQQIDRHYAENDLAELYKFEPRPPEPREIPPLPKDRLFAEMLKDHETQIYKYHEHDSLLENKEEETLTEEERKAAWEDFENEKTRPPPAPFPNMWPMHANGMSAGLMAQQQQQLAYAALSAMLRKDMPNINDNQIRDMLPLIYQANPAMFGGYDYGLMQKMSEIYKYAQPGMANPMMGPFMNAGKGTATAGGAGMGGSSGLQYEPPWQRQQQQQNQLRLQQLMQQQNSMGAKYYAGGLGSRDPVAMAMQQARAREIMLGESTGRPRGRPPLARPPPAPADVVNLDSD